MFYAMLGMSRDLVISSEDPVVLGCLRVNGPKARCSCTPMPRDKLLTPSWESLKDNDRQKWI